MEDLHRLVRVERQDDLRDRVEVSVDELADAPAVVDRAGHEELEARYTERVLHVDEEQRDSPRVVSRRPKPVRPSPRGRVRRALLVRDPPDLRNALRIEVRRYREHLALESRAVPADGGSDGRRLALLREPSELADHLGSDPLLRGDRLPPLAHDPADAEGAARRRRREVPRLRG